MTTITIIAFTLAAICSISQTVMVIIYGKGEVIKMIGAGLGMGIIMFNATGYFRAVMDARNTILGDGFVGMSQEKQTTLETKWKEFIKAEQAKESK